MIDLTVTANPSRYTDYVTYNKNGNTILQLEVKKALYGCMESARLLWEDITDHLVNKLGFIVNPYDMCVANKVIEGKQCTILWHVDDFKVSHPNKTVVCQAIAYLEERYGKMDVKHGPEQTFVEMDINFLQSGEVKFYMKGHVESAIDDSPEETSTPRTSLASDGVFTVSSTFQVLDTEQ